MPRNPERPGTYVTFRLHQEDRDLLQNLGRLGPGVEDRHQALLDLVPIVRNLDLPDIRERERRPIRIRIPAELQVEINRKVEATGQTFLGILLEAAREYQSRHERRPGG